ncbi:hypothetical protein [Virgisporangium aurantiacum]|uniref:hypothetical protein n=1 Tax=Virgisporangium aurantiacum TaxID=175570 RepID=UPI0019527D2B|nr:hypothetical protein [Virgisporangium aurantiacum]
MRPLLKVAQLRELLDRVERNGGGDWDVDIFPDSLIARDSEQDDIDFGLLRYGITGVDALGGDGTQDFVLLRFAPAPLNTCCGRPDEARLAGQPPAEEPYRLSAGR